MSDWISVNHATPKTDRVLTYSPDYPDNPQMTYRIINTQFLKICSDVTHWQQLEPPEESVEKEDDK